VFSCCFYFHEQVNGIVHVSVPVSIVSIHLKLCKVCVELERNARKSGGGGDFSARNPVDLSYRNPLNIRSAWEI
jgi:hypothetical protein